jgi:hypothetical protein
MTVNSSVATERVAFRKIAPVTCVASLGSAAMNAIVWLVGNAVGPLTIGLTEVLLFSALGALGGAGLYALLGLTTRRPVWWFVRISAAVVAIYALGPLTAALSPYMEGAAIFNAATVIATELMHLISAAWVVGALGRWARG